jgi:flagellum-specific peptidoglycan hydrolase FlgJ
MFSQGQFLIDPDASPEEIVRKREALNKVMRAYGRANNIGEGVGDLMMGVGQGVQNWRVGKAERSQSESANSAFESLLGGGAPAAPTMDAGGFPSAPSVRDVLPAQTEGQANSTGMPAPSVTNISGSKAEFVNALLPAAIEESKRTGIDPRIIVAQAAQETGWGRSAPGNNYFGIKSHGKSGGQNLTTHEVINGKRVKINDSFRTFASPADSVRGYGDFMLQNPRYKPMREAGDFDSQLAALQASGYATDPNYSASVGSIARGIQIPEAAPQSAAQAATLMAGNDSGVITDPEAYNASVLRQSPDLTGPEPSTVKDMPARQPAPQGQPPIVGIQPTPPTMQDMVGRMPAPEGQPMAQGRDALAQALMQQTGTAAPQAIGAGQQAIEQAAPQNVDPRAQFNSPQLNAADPTRGILKVLMERGGQPAQANPATARVQQAMQGQSGGTSLDLNKAIELMNNPFLDQGKKAVLGAMIERQMAAQDPMRQMQLEKGQLELERLRNPQADIPDSVRALQMRAEAAGLQPGTPEYSNFMVSGGKGPLVTVDNRGSSKYNEEIDKNFAQQYIDLQNGAQAAQNKIATLQGLQDALGQSSFTGMGAETLLGVKQAARTLGIDIGADLGPEETARALGNQLALQMRSPSNGAGMPGAMSNQDREFLVASVPGLGKTPEGNARLIDFMTRVEKRNIQVAQMAQTYQERNGQLNNGFYQELSAWSAQNPLFPEADQPAQAAPAQKPISEMTDEELEALANGE